MNYNYEEPPPIIPSLLSLPFISKITLAGTQGNQRLSLFMSNSRIYQTFSISLTKKVCMLTLIWFAFGINCVEFMHLT